MRTARFIIWMLLCFAAVSFGKQVLADEKSERGEIPQYHFENITISEATANEPVQKRLSLSKAATYLEQGARAWNGQRKCITCHTNGTYMLVRPALTARLGPPPADLRDEYVALFKQLAKLNGQEIQQSTRPGQVIYAAAGLAQWDTCVTKSLSAETKQALALMFKIQLPTGTWGSADCWPPYESDAFHEATVAAIAVAVAPGWIADLKDASLRTGVERLKNYLRTATPPHDYGRMLLLWASTKMPDLLDRDRQQKLVETVSKHQREDGGWSIRDFAASDAWGRGNRAQKLREEPEFKNPPSDGHQTGMAIVVLREAGIPASDPRIQRGVAWLLKNQRISGRWWTRSLNSERRHFITYSGTAFPLLALSLCNALPVETAATSK